MKLSMPQPKTVVFSSAEFLTLREQHGNLPVFVSPELKESTDTPDRIYAVYVPESWDYTSTPWCVKPAHFLLRGSP